MIVVEHDEEAIRAADHVVDLGPGAGVHGGQIVAQGTPRDIEAQPGLAHRAVPVGRASRSSVPRLRSARDPTRQIAHRRRAPATTCRTSTVEIPLGLLTCVTGVSGSGKSTLINDTLFGHARRALNGARAEARAVRARSRGSSRSTA